MPDIQSLIQKMTLEEKAALCTGISLWKTFAVERLGIPQIFMTDGPNGVRKAPDIGEKPANSEPATCFPTASCSASTWDPDLLFKMGEALAEECIAQNVDILLGPGVNMKRSPLCGRNFEYMSEDPFLAGEMAVGLINGIQSRGVGTSLKHFAANNQEFQRHLISAEIDERTLREIYLPAFEKAVKQAKPWTVMCAYNRLNGTYCSEHERLLGEILKDEWGFEGLVVSDWSAVHDRVASLEGRLDLEMPGPQPRRVQAVIEAVRSGDLDEKLLDESVRRILRIVFKARETPKGGRFDVEAHHELARRIAGEGIVLLKNNGLLPLTDSQHIAVIGRSAENAYFQGGGSAHVNPTRVDVPFKELQARAGNAELTYAEGYSRDGAFRQDLIDQAVSLAHAADAAVLYMAPPEFTESEGYDRKSLDLIHQEIALIRAVANAQPKTVVVLNNGAPVAMSEWIDLPGAVLEGWMMGQAGGAAIADVIFGKINPSGKLSESIPVKLADTPAFLNWPGEVGQVKYGEGLFIGYRYYDARAIPVQFPFGHGLSYTTFAYNNPNVSAETFRDTDDLVVSVDVTNTGTVAGKEIVQVYVHDRKSSLVRPPKELKGFAKVELQPGETKTVSIRLDFRAFAFYHPFFQRWVTEDGEIDLLIGASSADIRCTLTATLQSTVELPCAIDTETTIREWMDDPRGKVVLGPHLQKIEDDTRRLFSGGDEKRYGDALGMGIYDMIADMPLAGVLGFHQRNLPKRADEIVAEWIREAHALEK